MTSLEECSPLRQRLLVTANNLVTIKGDRLIVAISPMKWRRPNWSSAVSPMKSIPSSRSHEPLLD